MGRPTQKFVTANKDQLDKISEEHKYLIEEKAYKLDDLTEKVSVFYLYEKLSDEQFETIYSALYPFVEDEIIEEPVVEELPEVVEDEVIM